MDNDLEVCGNLSDSNILVSVMIVTSTYVRHSSDEEKEQECTELLIPMFAQAQIH